MPKMPGLFQPHRVFHFRIRVPARLRPLTGKQELRRSLATRCPREATRRARQLALLVERIFATVDGMTRANPAEIEAVVREFYEAELANEEHMVLHFQDDVRGSYRDNGETPPAAVLRVPVDRTDEIADARRRLASGLVDDAAARVVEELAGKLGMDDPASRHDGRRYLGHLVSRAMIELLHRRDELERGLPPKPPEEPFLRQTTPPRDTAAAAAAASPTPPTLTDNQACRISAALEQFLKEHKGLSAKTVADYERTVNWFVDLVGDHRMGELTNQHLVKFKTKLLDLPVGFTTRLKIESPSEALRFNQEREEKLETIDVTTVNNKYLSNIRAFFKWCHANAYTSEQLGANLRVSVKTGAYTEDELRVPFAKDQLETIFAAPLFQGCASPSRVFKPGNHLDDSWRFWAVLIGLYSGARSNEIGQLIRADISEHEGVPHFWIRRQLTEEERRARVRKRLKSESAHRLIPIHPELVRLGLLRWIQAQPGVATDRLFPDWKADKNGYFSNKMTKFFCQQFLPVVGLKLPQLAFHSLRHTMTDALRQAGLEERACKRVLGHAGGDTNTRYGKPASLVPAEIEKFCAVTFDCPALARIQPRA